LFLTFLKEKSGGKKMAGLNKVMLIGFLGRDPEIRYSQQGLAVVSFSMATSEQWTDKNTGEKQEKTEWHRIVAFGKPAEILEKYLSKGSQVYIEGRLQTRNYEKDGQTHYTTEIVVTGFQFLGGGQKNNGNPQGKNDGTPQQNPRQPQNQNQNPNTNAMTPPSMTPPAQPDPGVYNGFSDDDIPF
jgi:single-strand DNA-binding protein